MAQEVSLKSENQYVMEKFAGSISSLLLSIGIMVSYGYIALKLDPNNFLDLVFWNPIATIASITNILIIGLIVYNAHVNFELRNLFLKVPIDNVEVLYLMCLPALIVVIIMSFLKTTLNLVTFTCSGFGSAIFSLTLSAYLVAVLILLIETNGHVEYGEEWTINFSNYATVLFTITSLIGYTILNVSTEQAVIFIDNINITFMNCSTNTYFSDKISSVWDYLQSYMWKSSVLFGITCSIFLINPLLRHRIHLEKYIIDYQNDINVANPTQQTISIKLIYFVIFYALILLSSALLIVFETNEIWKYVYQSFTIITYILMIYATVKIIYCVKSWHGLEDKQRTFNDILVWMTFCGILFHCLAMIVASINQLMEKVSLIYIITLVKYILLMVQILVQNLLEVMLLNKTWKQQKIKYFNVVLPMLLFLGLCNGILALSNYVHSGSPFITPISGKFFIEFFVRGFDNLGEIFGTLQRIHGSVLFLYLFITIRKEKLMVHIEL